MAAAPLSLDFTQKSTSCAPCTALPSVLAEIGWIFAPGIIKSATMVTRR
jgi:hypothetical protein